MVSRTTVFYIIIGVLLSATTIFYSSTSTNDEEEFPVLKDTIGNLTDAQQATIKNAINNAQSRFNSTNLEGLASAIAVGIQNVSNMQRWNVYAYEGIRQIGINASSTFYNKYMWLVHYGKYSLTYVFIGFINCKYEMTGGSSPTQFGDFSDDEKNTIMAIIDNAIIYQGNNITANTFYIQQKMKIAFNGNWAIVVADPTARYGYHVCRVATQKWFALRQFKTFKWNYFGSQT